jgi:hypothetical protein
MVASLVRTSDDEYSACGSMGVPPASGIDRHAFCQRNGQVSLNAEVAHCLPVGWTGRRLTAEWAGLIKCRGDTSLVRQRALSAINAGAAQPGGLTSGSARWLMPRVVGHVAASELRLGGEQKRMPTGPHQAGPGHMSAPDPHLGPIQGPGMPCPGTLGPLCGRPGPHSGVGGSGTLSRGPVLHTWRSGTNPLGPDCIFEGPGPTLGVRTVYPGSGALPWGFGLTVNASGCTTFSGHVAASGPPMWRSRVLLWTEINRLRLGRAVA